jgi:hypothetical protein
MISKKITWTFFVLLAVIVGLYPLLYLYSGFRAAGFLSGKAAELRDHMGYLAVFYTHVAFGGIALVTGWSQFSEKFRLRHLQMHRSVGKIYVFSVLLSSISGFAIAIFATGGLVSILGFAALAVSWLFSNIKAYTSILNRNVQEHQNWMIRNYALTFAAVTLRLWLPFSQAVLHMDFNLAYQIIAWMCWLPNLLIATLIINRKRLTLATAA